MSDGTTWDDIEHPRREQLTDSYGTSETSSSSPEPVEYRTRFNVHRRLPNVTLKKWHSLDAPDAPLPVMTKQMGPGVYSCKFVMERSMLAPKTAHDALLLEQLQQWGVEVIVAPDTDSMRCVPALIGYWDLSHFWTDALFGFQISQPQLPLEGQ